jgi:hydroxylamine dehydrogenase
MKHLFGRVGIMCLALLIVGAVAVVSAQTKYPNLGQKELIIKRGFTKEALSCIECHAKKIPVSWRAGDPAA